MKRTRRWSQEPRARPLRRSGCQSDASVPGDGEVKCVEYLDACAREAARSGDPRPRDVVLYGGDVDLVVMALCRAQPGPGPVFGPHVRSRLVLSDAGRVLDVGALADALCARVARKNDEEDPTLERRQVALDFATLAVAAGGTHYLPPPVGSLACLVGRLQGPGPSVVRRNFWKSGSRSPRQSTGGSTRRCDDRRA